MAAACSPCIFGALSSTILTYPTPLGVVDVQIIPHISFASNGSASTSLETSTLAAPTAANAAVSTVTFTDASQLTWETSGTTLTYPTTYVDYGSFAGAAATTGCAESLKPSPLTLAAASSALIYPVDPAGGLPSGLVSFLDGPGGFPAQLNNDQVTQCAPLASGSAVTATITGVTSSPVTIQTTLPPPTTFTSEATSSFTSVATISPPAAVTQTSGLIFNSVTQGPVVYSNGVSTSLPSAQAQSLGSSTSLNNLSSIISALSQASASSASVSANLSTSTSSTSSSTSTKSSLGTSSTTAKSVPSSSTGVATTTRPSASVSKTSSPSLYTGAASRYTAPLSNSILADAFGFVAFLLFM